MASGETKVFSLYRAVSPQELADLQSVGRLRSIPASLEGKWFAEEFGHAIEWGNQLYRQEPFQVVRADVPLEVAALMFRLSFLDQIGPARYADDAILQMQNLISWTIVVETGG